MSRRLPVKDAISAGGVVWRRAPTGEIEVVVCGRTAGGVWGLPKGTPEPGEPLEATAIREVEEETGLRVSPGPRLTPIDYWFVAGGARIHKRVQHWLMEATGGDIANHDAEFDDVRWVPLEEAALLLTYPDESEVVREAGRRIREAGPWTAGIASV